MSNIQHSILQWFDLNKRDLPWRESKNPYYIWISEIILQQTRVEQGLPYYERFISAFPTVFDLANAREEEVLFIWKGLGYYTRARNLHKAAKIVVDLHGGGFPNEYTALLDLPGIGAYTAAAIVSICWNKPFIALDGNVVRILSRVFDVDTPFNNNKGRSILKALGHEVISQDRPGDFNQALMDLGSAICLPKNPRCDQCPILGYCESKKKNTHLDLPVKPVRRKPKDRFLVFYLAEKSGSLAFCKQKRKGIWHNLFLLPSKELQSALQFDQTDIKNSLISSGTHLLTHQRIHYEARKISFEELGELTEENFVWIDVQELERLPVPKLMSSIIVAWQVYQTKD